MSGITFGSVGDIITVGQIAWSLAKSLSDSRGSAKEYQGLIKELETFDQALLQVVALWQNYEDSPELNELGTITKNAVKDWRDILQVFKLKFDNKYGKSLCAGGSGSRIKDVSKKVLWLKEKDDILDLRRKLQTASDTITMLILATMGKSNKLAESTQAYRVQAVHCILQESIKLAEEQASKLKVIDEKMDSQAKVSDLILSTVRSGITSLTQVQSIVIDMRALLGLFHNHMYAQQATPRSLGTHWQQAPVTLEDALGNIIPLPLELVNSWDMFDMILSERFKKHPGHRKVQRGEFAIEEDITGRELSREWDWSMCFRPGQKIDMSMVFSDLDNTSNRCPRCKTESAASAEVRTQCQNPACRMWFQRVEEVEHFRTQMLVDVGEEIKIPKRPAGPSILPGDFQRVRLMTNHKLKEPTKLVKNLAEFRKALIDTDAGQSINEESVSTEEEHRYREHRSSSGRKSELDAETILKLDRLKVYEKVEADREYEKKLKKEIELQKAKELYEAEPKAKKDKELQKEYVERWKREEAEKKEKAKREKEEEDAKFEERFKIQLMQGYTQAQAEAMLKKKEKEKKEGEEYDGDSRTSVSSLRRDGTYTTVKRYRIGEDRKEA